MFDIFERRIHKPDAAGIARNRVALWVCQKGIELKANRRLVFGDLAAAYLAAMAALWLVQADTLSSANAIAPLGGLVLVLSLVIFSLAGFYRRHTRSTSVRDVTILSRGALASILAQALAAQLIAALQFLPWSLYLFQFLLTVPALGALRIAARRRELMRNTQREQAKTTEMIPVLLVGTGTNCDLFLRSLRNTASRYHPVGIIDDARDALGLYFHYVKIVGSVLDPHAAIKAVESGEVIPKQLLLTEHVTHFDSDGIHQLLAWAKTNGVQVARLPGLSDPEIDDKPIAQGNVREVDPEEILERPQKEVEKSLLRALFQGRRVLITGAGGSIGSELTRQVASFDPALLVLIDNCEFNAYSIDMDLAQHFPDVPRRVHVASVRDALRIRSIFLEHRPELVFNAAALKHVPMVELNPCEGVLTNVVGTRNVADCTREVGANALVQISTDKAVNTTNVMGATKRVAEFYVQAQDRITNETQEQTRFFSVRFGNVLGSSGSLIPLFQRQIHEGGPLTVTDKRMERFFMTIREAVELTLVAAAKGLAQNAGLGEIFVLDMGEPVRIVDLAERMIKLAGLEPYKDIDIKFIGVRPGEKLFEELFDKSEMRRDSGIEAVNSAVPDGIPIAHLRAAIVRLEEAARCGDERQIRRLLQDLVPGYGRVPHADLLRPPSRAIFPTSKRRRPIAGPKPDPDAATPKEQRLWAGE